MDGSFGALLRAHRRAKGLTQEALAERSAMSGQAIGALERGDRRFPHRDTVARLADALRLDDGQRAVFTATAARRPVPRSDASGTDVDDDVDNRVAEGNPAPPRQLPAAVAHFIERGAAAKAMAGEVSAISGMAGIGKTAFAVHCAHQIKDRYPDGQLYANLRGFDPSRSPLSPESVIRAFLEALGTPPTRIPAGNDAQIGLYRSLLADRRMLIVLDNVLDAEQVRPLLPGTPGCLTLITSRNQLTSLAATDGARLITLDPLTRDEARELLTARLGADRVAAEPSATDGIIDRCGRLPLALAIVAARAAARPDFPLATLAEELGEGNGGAGDSLDALRGGDAATNVRTAFSLSYQALSPPAARLFRLLGLHPGPDVSLPAAASLVGLPARRARPVLTELADANLVAEPRPGRFTLHDLLRAYAAEQVQKLEPERGRHAATHRMLDHYLHCAHAAGQTLAPTRDRIELAAPQPGTSQENLAHEAAALDWFTTERMVLLAMIDQVAGDAGTPTPGSWPGNAPTSSAAGAIGGPTSPSSAPRSRPRNVSAIHWRRPAHTACSRSTTASWAVTTRRSPTYSRRWS